MRVAWTVMAALAGMLASHSVAAQEAPGSDGATAAASAAVGAGVFAASPAATLDLGVDVASDRYAMGFGARLRWVGDQGFRSEDWDERSEWSRLLRYLTYVREDQRITATVAAGELGSATLGQGALVHGYASGLNVDHHHLGVELGIAVQRGGAQAVIDDVVAPRIAGTRAYWYGLAEHTRADLGVSVTADARAPGNAGMDTTALPMAALDARYQLHTRDRRMSGALDAQLAAISTMAAGLHLGISGTATLARDTRVSVRGEVRLGTDRYIPGWIGPLYEIDRRQLDVRAPDSAADPMVTMTQLDVARGGGLGGLGVLAEAQVAAPGLGEVALAYTRRAGLADLLVARVSAPYARVVQAGVWMATELNRNAGPRTWVVAAELRAPIWRTFFATAEAARMYRLQDTSLAPLWQAGAAIGASLDM